MTKQKPVSYYSRQADRLHPTNKPDACKICGDITIYKSNRCYKCFREYANELLRKWHKNNPKKYKEYDKNKIKASPVIKCKYCGKDFNRYIPALNFCSRNCAYNYWKENNIRAGKNNPAFRNGLYTKKYLSNHKNITGKHLSACRRYRTFFRKNNDYDFCERCKISSSPKFETHHIVFSSEAPEHKELHNFKNLIYLCIACHNELHKHKILRNKLVEDRELNDLFGRNFTVYEKININKTTISK